MIRLSCAFQSFNFQTSFGGFVKLLVFVYISKTDCIELTEFALFSCLTVQLPVDNLITKWFDEIFFVSIFIFLESSQQQCSPTVVSFGNSKMSSPQKLKFCANLSMMYSKEASSLLDRYTLARSYGFKGNLTAAPQRHDGIFYHPQCDPHPHFQICTLESQIIVQYEINVYLEDLEVCTRIMFYKERSKVMYSCQF